jgi:hypothetical protein
MRSPRHRARLPSKRFLRILNVNKVTFNGVAAKFTIKSTLIEAVVPAGATSGVIEVTNPNGTASSKKSFTVED